METSPCHLGPTSMTPHPQTCQDSDGFFGFLLLISIPLTAVNLAKMTSCLPACHLAGETLPRSLPCFPTSQTHAQPPRPQDLSPAVYKTGHLQVLGCARSGPQGSLGHLLWHRAWERPLRAPPVHPTSPCCRAGMVLILVQRTHYFIFQAQKPHMWS